MALVTLLHLPDEERARTAFSWEHDILHRHKTPTFLLDPLQNTNEPGSKWHFDHQIAQNRLKTGSFILRDSDLSNSGQKAWWEFANHWEHYLSG
jgi:hypothetical protein